MLVSASAAPRGKALIGRISLGSGRRGRAVESIGIGAGGLGAGVFAILGGYRDSDGWMIGEAWARAGWWYRMRERRRAGKGKAERV